MNGPAANVDISPRAWDAYLRGERPEAVRGAGGIEPAGECQTCENRRYVDQSDDSSVSFQTPTKISPGQAASAVASHEREHIANDRAEAEREGRRVVSQSVSMTMASCPECGTMYVSGGSARTVSVKDAPDKQAEAVELLLQPGQASQPE